MGNNFLISRNPLCLVYLGSDLAVLGFDSYVSVVVAFRTQSWIVDFSSFWTYQRFGFSLSLQPGSEPEVHGALVQLQFVRLIIKFSSKIFDWSIFLGFSDVDHEWSLFLKEYNAATFVASPHLVHEEAIGLFLGIGQQFGCSNCPYPNFHCLFGQPLGLLA